LFLKTLGPYVEFLDGCLTEGKLTDDSDEFCIQRYCKQILELVKTMFSESDQTKKHCF
jgi:hypothetical protein